MYRTILGMAKVTLTVPRILEFKCPPGKPQAFLWDARVPGLGVRTTPRGTPSFIFKGSYQGVTIRVTIGSASTWKIPEAQSKAREMQRQIDEGRDPRALKSAAVAMDAAARDDERNEGLLVGTVWADYMSNGGPLKKKVWKPGYKEDLHIMSAPGGIAKKRGTGLTLPGPIAPLLKLKMGDINPKLLRAWLQNETKRGAAQATRALQMFSGFLRWCSTQDKYDMLIDTNAARDAKVKGALPAPGRRRTDAVEAGQLKAFFEGIEQLENRTAATYIACLVLTGARREELAVLEWSNIDFRWKKLTIPDKVSPTRTIPLTAYLEHLFRSLPKIKGNPFVFASTKGTSGRLMDIRNPLAKVILHAGIGRLTPHGERRTFSLMGEAAGCPAGAIAQIMGHQPGSVSENYRPRPIDTLRPLMQTIESFILEKAEVPFDASPPAPLAEDG